MTAETGGTVVAVGAAGGGVVAGGAAAPVTGGLVAGGLVTDALVTGALVAGAGGLVGLGAAVGLGVVGSLVAGIDTEGAGSVVVGGAIEGPVGRVEIDGSVAPAPGLLPPELPHPEATATTAHAARVIRVTNLFIERSLWASNKTRSALGGDDAKKRRHQLTVVAVSAPGARASLGSRRSPNWSLSHDY